MKKLNLKYIFIIIVLNIIILNNVHFISALKNPAPVYCKELGYKYNYGNCIINENFQYDAGDFLAGKVGNEYSYCSKKGYKQIQLFGNNSFSYYHTGCLINGKIISVTELMNFSNLLQDTLPLNPNLVNNLIKNNNIPKSKLVSSSQSINLPLYFDWRNKDGHDWTTPVKDQDPLMEGCGSCWAFAAIGAMESNLKISQKKT